jgi:nucleoid DNA-binding protein
VSNKSTRTFNRSDIETELLSQFPDLTKKQIKLAIDSMIESIANLICFFVKSGN